jgi:hypothetical protein
MVYQFNLFITNKSNNVDGVGVGVGVGVGRIIGQCG